MTKKKFTKLKKKKFTTKIQTQDTLSTKLLVLNHSSIFYLYTHWKPYITHRKFVLQFEILKRHHSHVKQIRLMYLFVQFQCAYICRPSHLLLIKIVHSPTTKIPSPTFAYIEHTWGTYSPYTFFKHLWMSIGTPFLCPKKWIAVWYSILAALDDAFDMFYT